MKNFIKLILKIIIILSAVGFGILVYMSTITRGMGDIGYIFAGAAVLITGIISLIMLVLVNVITKGK